MRDGRTGYDLLADHIPQARAVLDLGTGNGPLVASLLERCPELESIIGLDACASEVELARARFAADPRVSFSIESADRMGLADHSMDAVLSHHAFYLMQPIEAVVAQVARVLRPGGVLAFVTWSARARSLEPFAELMRELASGTRRDAEHFQGWGDPRAFSLEGLHQVLVASRWFDDPLTWDEHDLELAEAPDQLVERLLGFFYSAHLQGPETLDRSRQAWRRIVERHVDAAGIAHVRFPFACVRAIRSVPVKQR